MRSFIRGMICIHVAHAALGGAEGGREREFSPTIEVGAFRLRSHTHIRKRFVRSSRVSKSGHGCLPTEAGNAYLYVYRSLSLRGVCASMVGSGRGEGGSVKERLTPLLPGSPHSQLYDAPRCVRECGRCSCAPSLTSHHLLEKRVEVQFCCVGREHSALRHLLELCLYAPFFTFTELHDAVF